MSEPDFKADEAFHMINDEYRVNTVIEFIRNHEGCGADEVVSRQQISAREKVYKILKELKQLGIIIDNIDKNDKRKKKLFIQNDNPLVSITFDLDGFEKDFEKLIEQSVQEFRLRYARILLKYSQRSKAMFSELHAVYQLVVLPLHIFHDVSNLYNMSSIFSWPKVSDKRTLNALYIISSRKLLRIQLRLFRTINILKDTTQRSADSVFKSVFIDRLIDVEKNQSFADKFILYFDIFAKFGLGKRIKPILDFVWKLSFEHRAFLYPELNDLRYENGWKSLLSSQ